MTLGLREANQQFARLMKTVRHGQEVVLTDRGRPIAVVRPLPAEPDEAARLSRLASEGVIRPATRPRPMPSPKWAPVRLTGESVTETVNRDRGEHA